MCLRAEGLYRQILLRYLFGDPFWAPAVFHNNFLYTTKSSFPTLVSCLFRPDACVYWCSTSNVSASPHCIDPEVRPYAWHFSSTRQEWGADSRHFCWRRMCKFPFWKDSCSITLPAVLWMPLPRHSLLWKNDASSTSDALSYDLNLCKRDTGKSSVAKSGKKIQQPVAQKRR